MIDHSDMLEASGAFIDADDERRYKQYLDSLYADAQMERMMDEQISKQFNQL